MSEELTRKLEDLLGPLLAERGLELVDLEQSRKGRKLWIRLFIDRLEGGINVEECGEINREFGTLLDVEGLIEESYLLEVSSPGLDRRIRKVKDFKRFESRVIRVVTRKKIEGRNRFLGQLKSADDQGIILMVENKEVFMAHENIARANLEYDFA